MKVIAEINLSVFLGILKEISQELPIIEDCLAKKQSNNSVFLFLNLLHICYLEVKE